MSNQHLPEAIGVIMFKYDYFAFFFILASSGLKAHPWTHPLTSAVRQWRLLLLSKQLCAQAPRVSRQLSGLNRFELTDWCHLDLPARYSNVFPFYTSQS